MSDGTEDSNKPISRPTRFSGHVPTRVSVKKEPPTSVFAHVAVDDGRVDLAEVVNVCQAIGKMLQAVPKKERKFTVARLSNVAKTHRENGDSPLTYLTIEALIAGWEDWP